MARPTTKTDLIQAANEQSGKLWKLIDSMTEKEQHDTFKFEDRDKNIRDVLVHLYEWHLLLLNWTNANRKGEQKPFLPEPYNWKTYPVMNVELWKKHQQTAYDDSKKMLKEIIRLSYENGAKFVWSMGGVTLRDNQRMYFYNQLDKHFEGVKDRYIKTFENNYICNTPNKNIAMLFKEECRKYGLLYRMHDIIKAYKKPRISFEQLSLWQFEK